MDRRAFLRHLGFGTVSAAAAALTWDIERLLWVPGEKTILLPAVQPVNMVFSVSMDWTQSQLHLTQEEQHWVARELAKSLDEQLYGELTIAQLQRSPRPPLQIRSPQRFVVTEGS